MGHFCFNEVLASDGPSGIGVNSHNNLCSLRSINCVLIKMNPISL